MTTQDDPLTTEEAYDDARRVWNLTDDPEIEADRIRIMFDALRAMIARRDREMDSILRALTALNNRVSALESHECVPDLGPLTPFLPPEPDEVAVPRSLVEALETARNDRLVSADLMLAFDAWKAGQER